MWPIDEKKYENMSFLPPLSDMDIAKQVSYLVFNGWVPCVEFAMQTEGFAVGGNSANYMGPGYYDNRYWVMWKLPMYGCTNPDEVLQEIRACTQAFPECFIRVAGFDQGMSKRFSMCGLICVPSPSMNRPFEIACKSQPMFARIIGLRANPIATAV